MAYTFVAKPTSAPYTNLNTAGREQYDQAVLVYDDSGTFYDGVNASAYTLIGKPTDTQITIKAGMTTALSIPLTYSTDHVIGTSRYTKVSKPTL